MAVVLPPLSPKLVPNSVRSTAIRNLTPHKRMVWWSDSMAESVARCSVLRSTLTGIWNNFCADSPLLITPAASACSTAKHQIRSWRNASKPVANSSIPKRTVEQDPTTSSRHASLLKLPRRFYNQTSNTTTLGYYGLRAPGRRRDRSPVQVASICWISRRACGSVQSAFRGPPLLFPAQKQVRQHHHRDVVVPARPAPALEVIQPQLFLHLLVVLLHPPTPPCRGHQPPPARAFRQITKVVFDRLQLVCWPLHQQPNLLTRRLAMVPVMCALHPLRPETRGQPALAALPPSHLPNRLLVRYGQFFHRDRFLVAEAHTLCGTAAPGPVRNGSAGRLRPDPQRLANAHGIGQTTFGQRFAERCHVTIAGIGQHRRGLVESPGHSLIDQCQCQSPMGLEADLFRHTSRSAAPPIVGPFFGQIETEA